MKKLLSIAIIAIVGLAGCKFKKVKEGVSDTNTPLSAENADMNTLSSIEHVDVNTPLSIEFPDVNSSNYDSLRNVWKQKFDFDQNINALSVQNLRLLRNLPYAVNGLYFMEADLYAFFKAAIPWYEQYMWNTFEEDKMLFEYKDVKLSVKEKAFVEKVDKRMEELQKDMYITKNGSRIGNASHIVNMFQFKETKPDFMEKITQHNFVITEGGYQQLFHVYEENAYQQMPSFITTDLFLQAFHIYFSYVLKSLEQEKFIPAVEEICVKLYEASMNLTKSQDADVAKMAEYNAVFYAIPYTLLTGKALSVPVKYQNAYQTEIDRANKAIDMPSEFLSTQYDFPYSLFKPRGHYSRKPVMQAYFKAMMWLQVAYFCRENDNQLKQCIFTASLLHTTKSSKNKPLMDVYASVFEPVAFLVGLPDNLSIMDIVQFLKHNNITEIQQALSAENMEKINHKLITLTETRNLIKPKIQVTCPDKINFMPQRYLIDNEVLLNLVDTIPNSERCYPKGLDVFYAFGSSSAGDLLKNFYKESDRWAKYPSEMGKMQKKFDRYDGWNASVYNKWIESLLSLQKTDKNYPVFMQTKAWDYKNLNTSLASWAELKHDAILYGEQPMTAECGGGGPPEPIVTGYVEPNLLFWNKLNELITLTSNLLSTHGLLNVDLNEKTNSLLSYVSFLTDVSELELANKSLSEEQFRTIEHLGSSIEWFTLSILDPDIHLDNWSLVQGADRSIAVVADVYTRNVDGCNKNGILHVATGSANNLYVVVEINGCLRLTRGATFSYYEFVQPPGIRLTDEEWQSIEQDHAKRPPLLEWMKDIVTGDKPKSNSRNFYSSGC